jgi:hypothetical protein
MFTHEYNLARAKHGVPALRLSQRLSQSAQRYAERLLSQDASHLPHSGRGGENLKWNWNKGQPNPVHLNKLHHISLYTSLMFRLSTAPSLYQNGTTR